MLSFFEHVLVFVIDDTVLAMLDIWQSWSKFVIQTDLDHISNVRLVKVDPSRFMIIAVKFTMYEVVTAPKLRLKLIEEIIAWQVYSHQKMLVASHQFKRTELIMANQQKEWGIVHSVILWKTKQIKQV